MWKKVAQSGSFSGRFVPRCSPFMSERPGLADAFSRGKAPGTNSVTCDRFALTLIRRASEGGAPTGGTRQRGD
jgi:hypothetical protein